MSIHHLISIDREAKLSINTGRLKIDFLDTKETHLIAVCDIAVLILANRCISMSLAVMQELAQNGAIILAIGEKNLPRSISLPVGINEEGARRPFYQAKSLDSQVSQSWWAQLIEAKILGQALVADLFDKDIAGKLRKTASHVELGDKSACEAQAARYYWPKYFQALDSLITTRDKQGASDPINIALNYGYAILRATVARSLVGAGLCLNFGVGHHRKDNPFNLAEDFVEPFRFIVDMAVWQIFDQFPDESFDKELKKQLLSKILAAILEIDGKDYRLFYGIDYAVNSFCLSLEDPRRKLLLPNLPTRPGKTSTAQLWQSKQFTHETE